MTELRVIQQPCDSPARAAVPRNSTAPDRVDLVLVVPPSWELSFQSIGIPALAAWCRRLGYEVDKLDLNLDFHRYVCGGAISLEFARSEYERVLAMPLYRDRYEVRRDDTMIRIDLPFGYCHLVCNNYSRLGAFLSDPRVNVPLAYYLERNIAPRLADAAPGKTRVVGITVEGENQAIGALTLARLIKARNERALIVLGGPWVTGLQRVLQHEGDLLKDIDFLIPNKGEIPLQLLLEAVAEADGVPAAPIGGVLTRRGSSYGDPAPFESHLKAADLPAPDIFPLSSYMRTNVLPYESERGCYWGHCKFCHHIQHYTHAYNSKPIDKVIAELKAYRQQFPFDVVAFVDAAIPPRRIREVAEAFIRENIGLRWAGFSRIEKQFTPELFQLAASSGLDVISFGVETASQRLAEYIGKPMNPEVARRVLEDCSNAGIYTTAGIMNGLPSETMEELQELWDFLDTIRPFTYLHPHLFRFEKGTDFYDHPERYGIEIVPNHPESRLSVYAEFIDRSGGNSRQYIIEHNANKEWWTKNMGRTLNWKMHSDQFCKGVQVIVDT